MLFVPNEVPSPALIICHGFDKRGFRGYKIFELIARKACERGFVCLVFDFRGCGRSGGAFGYGWGEQDDLETAVGYLLSRSEVCGKGVFVVGHSLGGAVALYVAERDKRVKGVALWAVPHDHWYNIRRFIRRNRGWLSWYLFLLVSYVDVVVDVSGVFGFRVWGFNLRPRDVRRRLMRLHESEVLARLENLPVLIVNGNRDALVDLEEARLNFDAAKDGKELVVVEQGDGVDVIGNHVFRGKEDEVVDVTLKWLSRLY